MNLVYKKTGYVLILLMVLAQSVLAAPAQTGNVTNIRFSQRPEAVRIVFDLDIIPEYKVTTASNGTRIIIDLPQTLSQMAIQKLAVKDPLIKNIVFSTVDKNTFRATIDLNRNAVYKVEKLGNPNRLYIDIIKIFDQKIVDEIAPGLKHITIMRGTEKGMITANILDVDLQEGYRLVPALASGKILGREYLSAIARREQAIGAVNASYFASSGEILGLTKIDSSVVSATYLTRSGFGILADGSPMIGQVSYNGSVRLADGTTLPVSGVNNERGENALVLYNSYYNGSTRSNAYGKEYVVKDDEVTAIYDADAPLGQGTVVVSVHGTQMKALEHVKIGDRMEIVEELGDPWNKATQILGVGPMLVKDNSVYLTTKEERFGSDVAGGRAPRTAVGITEDRHILLAVVDGRQRHSIGFTLLELALFMQELGAVDAVNFDGGGSSEMIIRNEIINRPSDGTERNIGSALVILPK